MQQEIIEHARSLALVIANEIHAKYIFLFGSQAKGTSTDESDLDMFVVVDIKNKEKIDLLQKSRRSLLKKTSMPVDILLCDTRDFMANKTNKATLEYIVANEGVILYG